MRRPALLLLFLTAGSIATAAGGPYSVASHTRLGYTANANLFDAAHNRIYSSSRDGIYTIDTISRKVIGLALHVPIGALAFDAATSELYVLARNEDRLRVVDVNTRKVLREFPAPAYHNVVFEGTKSDLYYFRGDESVARVAEREHGEEITKIALDGHPSFVLADPPRHRILVRLFDRDLVQVIDTNERRLAVSWPLHADGTSAMAIDSASGRVFVSSGKNVKMLDGLSGKELGHFPLGDMAMAITYDPGTKIVAALWGASHVNVARVDLMQITKIQDLDLRTSARQLFIDPRTHTMYVMGLVIDDKGFGRQGSPDAAATVRISALLTLPYKE